MPVLTVLDEFPSYEQPSATCLQATCQSAMYFICLPHCGLCSSGDAKSHNSTTSAQNYTKSSKRFQQLMGTSTPLKACEHSGSFNLWVTCTEKIRNPFCTYSWHVRLRHQPSSHQPAVGRALVHISWSRRPSVSSIPPKLVKEMFQHMRAHKHGVRCSSLWRNSPPTPWGGRHPLLQDQPIATPSAASGRGRSVSLSLTKVMCLMAKLETCHKGKISNRTWNSSPSSAADSFHSISELPAAKVNSAAFLPCGITLPNSSFLPLLCHAPCPSWRAGHQVAPGAGRLTLFPGDTVLRTGLAFISTVSLLSRKSPGPHLSLLPRQLHRVVIPPLLSSESWITRMQM